MDLLKIGQRLSIFIEKEDKLIEMSCKISEIYDDRLVIALPQYFMRYVEYLEVGKRLTMKIFSKVGTIDFNAVVITSPLEDNFSVELDYNAMRLTESKEMPVINAVETLNLKRQDMEINAKTFEIAPEQIKFYSDKHFNLNEELDCMLILPKDYGTISFKATVTYIDPVYENEYTLSDFCMTEDDRQAVLYYMYIYSNDSEWNEQ